MVALAIMYIERAVVVFALCAGRVLDNLSEPLLVKFEQLAEKQGFGLNYLFPFPTYSTSTPTPPEKISLL